MNTPSAGIHYSKALIARLHKAAGTNTARALADLLGVKESTLSNHKARGKFPEKLLRRAAHKCGVDYDWLLTGEGRPYASTESQPKRKIEENQCGEMATLVRELRKQPNAAPWVRDLLRILRDGGDRRRLGIESNIEALVVSMGADPYTSKRDRGGGE